MIHHEFIDHLLCSIDPITLTGIALAGIAGFAGSKAAGGGSSASPTPPPAAPPAAAPPSTSPAGSNQNLKGGQPSFVGSSAMPTDATGQKTLIGA